MRFPSIADVAKELRRLNKYDAGDDIDPDTNEPYTTDVRLQVLPNGSWQVWWGLSDYDTDHRGYWGASLVPGGKRRFKSEDVAKDLIDQAKEMKATGGDDGDLSGPFGSHRPRRATRLGGDWEDEEWASDPEGEPDPSPEDYTITDSRHGVAVGQIEGDFLGEFPNQDAAEKFIARRMEQTKFWPSVWFVSDHGNFHPITDFPRVDKQGRLRRRGRFAGLEVGMALGNVSVRDNGAFYSISLGEREIAAFRRRWPASGLDTLRSVWFQFDKRNGDLVDIQVNGRAGDSGGRYDGDAFSALSRDAQVLAARALKKRGVDVDTFWSAYNTDLTWYNER